MKKILSILVFSFLFIFSSVFAYDIDEGASTIETVINKLEGSDYSFKYNAGSSAKASYHVFYKGNMIGYIYATENGITLGEGWDTKGELGIFYNQKELSVDEIVKRFYGDKKVLSDSGDDLAVYKCEGETKIFFDCISNNVANSKNTSGKIYLFDGKVVKDISITYGDNILYKDINKDGDIKTCNIKYEDKDIFLSMLDNWSEGAFSVNDLSYAECNIEKNSLDNGLGTDLSDLSLGGNSINSNLGLLNIYLTGSKNIGIDNDLEKEVNKYFKSYQLNKKNDINILDKNNNNKLVDILNNKPSYNDGLKIIDDTEDKIGKIDNKVGKLTLKEKMLYYRKIWHKTGAEVKKGKKGLEGLKIKYLHKKIEEKYKELFKEYVLSVKKGVNISKKNNNSLGKLENKKLVNKKNILSKNILNNFKLLFGLIKNKINVGNYTSSELEKFNSLFQKVENKGIYKDLNEFIGKDDNIFNNEYNIELLQKLLIIMCKK